MYRTGSIIDFFFFCDGSSIIIIIHGTVPYTSVGVSRERVSRKSQNDTTRGVRPARKHPLHPVKFSYIYIYIFRFSIIRSYWLEAQVGRTTVQEGVRIRMYEPVRGVVTLYFGTVRTPP
jgi:hypothetical protein